MRSSCEISIVSTALEHPEGHFFDSTINVMDGQIVADPAVQNNKQIARRVSVMFSALTFTQRAELGHATRPHVAWGG
jgi:hypothetical protein